MVGARLASKGVCRRERRRSTWSSAPLRSVPYLSGPEMKETRDSKTSLGALNNSMRQDVLAAGAGPIGEELRDVAGPIAQELRIARIGTPEEANRFLPERYIGEIQCEVYGQSRGARHGLPALHPDGSELDLHDPDRMLFWGL